jgi:hypothetical protein
MGLMSSHDGYCEIIKFIGDFKHLGNFAEFFFYWLCFSLKLKLCKNAAIQNPPVFGLARFISEKISVHS